MLTPVLLRPAGHVRWDEPEPNVSPYPKVRGEAASALGGAIRARLSSARQTTQAAAHSYPRDARAVPRVR
jgi:hypothetical protein